MDRALSTWITCIGVSAAIYVGLSWYQNVRAEQDKPEMLEFTTAQSMYVVRHEVKKCMLHYYSKGSSADLVCTKCREGYADLIKKHQPEPNEEQQELLEYVDLASLVWCEVIKRQEQQDYRDPTL